MPRFPTRFRIEEEMRKHKFNEEEKDLVREASEMSYTQARALVQEIAKRKLFPKKGE